MARMGPGTMGRFTMRGNIQDMQIPRSSSRGREREKRRGGGGERKGPVEGHICAHMYPFAYIPGRARLHTRTDICIFAANTITIARQREQILLPSGPIDGRGAGGKGGIIYQGRQNAVNAFVNNATFSLCGNPKCIFLPSSLLVLTILSSSYSSGGLPFARAPTFLDHPLRYIFPRKRFDLEIDRARSESKVEVALFFLPPPSLDGSAIVAERKEEVTSRAPATESDTHSACSSSSAGRPGNVRRSASDPDKGDR